MDARNSEAQSRQNDAAESDANAEAAGGPDWVALARQARENARAALDTDLSRSWERSLRHFQGRHAAGSKYLSDDYKGRSRIFRPKTRAMVRRTEAAGAAAFFSTADVIACTAYDDSDEMQVAAAMAQHETLNWRLKNSIPWFTTCIGALQDGQVYGVCVSKQYWRYEEREVGTQTVEVMGEDGLPLIDPETGAPAVEEAPIIEVVADQPVCKLKPPENILIDRAADWEDPINTSPFVIEAQPMYVGDVKARMNATDPKTGQTKWRVLDEATIKQASEDVHDNVRRTREGERQDPINDHDSPIDDFTIVWAHENIIRWEGRDWHYWTLGTRALLSDPVPLEEVYRHGRPYVMGYVVIETHKTYPVSKVQLTDGLQQQANEIVNQRLDNVKLAMNGRYKVKRGAEVDLKSLTRNVPGGAYMVTSPDDVTVEQAPDVTGSAYMEQDRVNIDFDEIGGTFSPGTVQSNRQMNETVGGMNLLSSSANGMTEYELRVFAETWVEPVVKQLMALERLYETDEVILSLVGKNAGLAREYYENADAMIELLQHDVQVSIDVGIGSTDQSQKLARFMGATKAAVELMGDMAPRRLDYEAVISELFGLSGYRDGMRFFKMDQDPQTDAMMQEIERLQRELETKQGVERVKTEGRLREIAAKGQIDLAKERLRGAVDMAEQRDEQEHADAKWFMEAVRDMVTTPALPGPVSGQPPQNGPFSGR